MTHALPWRAVAPEAIVVREWSDEIVVYNDSTGHTHHLAPLGGAVLLAFLHNPAGFELPQLIESVAAAVDIRESDILAPLVEEALEELSRLELVACDTA
ncbi:MAG TPA: HPr-rel-A system PqqD family peptide chaperone [Casimicrobiaceae bacterium]|nr:HPr-rel-A system PqqD family peptide chaperone [Casimicrobiaceae bacterium]